LVAVRAANSNRSFSAIPELTKLTEIVVHGQKRSHDGGELSNDWAVKKVSKGVINRQNVFYPNDSIVSFHTPTQLPDFAYAFLLSTLERVELLI
jgi:hypothetical protein